MKRIILFATCIWMMNNLPAQDFIWAKSMGGTNIQASEVPRSTAVDANGNIYTVGSFGGTVDFDPGPGVFNMGCNGCMPCCNPEDMFITKLDASGNFIWAKQIGGTQVDVALLIIIDNSANLYLTGWFTGTVDFDPGPATSNLTSVSGGSGFIVKLNSNGDFVWSVRTSAEIGYKLALNGGDLWLSGLKYNGANRNAYIAKYTTTGSLAFEKQFAGTSNITSCLIAVDGSSNVYATGFFNNTMDFDPGAGTVNLTSNGSTDIYLAKLDGSGNFVWVKQIGGTSLDAAGPIAVDPDGNIILSGGFQGTADLDPGSGQLNFTPVGSTDGFIIKVNNTGDLIWAKQIAGTNASSSVNLSSFALDNYRNILFTGYFIGTVDFDPGAGNFNLTNTNIAGGGACFILKLDPYGDFITAKHIDNSTGNSIAADQSVVTGGLYIVGTYHSVTDFDPGPGVFNLTSVGGGDMFFLKLTIRTAGDADWDGIPDASDNCPSASNVMQRDFDIDEQGDACDTDDDNDGSLDVNDCAPLDPSIHPGAIELCNNVDDNCNGEIDEGFRFYQDSDVDGYGNPNNFVQECSGVEPPGYLSDHSDCNDGNDLVHPGAQEICNGLDDDCDGLIDEGAHQPTITPSGVVNICAGTTILLTASPGGNYQWYRNNKVLPGQTSQTLLVSTSGGYSVKVFFDLCTAPLSDPTVVNVVTPPKATISYRGNTDICVSGSLELKAAKVNGATYQWNKDAVPIQGATAQTYIAAEAGSYTVTVSKNGCSSTSSPVIITNSCPSAMSKTPEILAETLTWPEFKMYPNPSGGEFSVSLNLKVRYSTSVMIQVFDMAGRVVISKYVRIENGYMFKKLSMPVNAPAGVYLVKVCSGQKIFMNKLVLAR